MPGVPCAWPDIKAGSPSSLFILLQSSHNTPIIEKLPDEGPSSTVHFSGPTDRRLADCGQHPPRFARAWSLGGGRRDCRTGSKGLAGQVRSRLSVSGDVGISFGGLPGDSFRAVAGVVSAG